MRKAKSHLFYDIYNQPYDDSTRLKLYSSSKSSLQLIQRMALLKRLKIHDGCVNSICWNSTGELILSGSDDQHLVLTDAYNYQVLTNYKTSHRANIFSAKFLPNSGDHRIVSCSGDGIILYTDLMRRMETFLCQFKCHSGTTYEIATVPGEPHSFLSCGEDGTVRWFDLRVKDKCSVAVCTEDVLIYCQKAVTALSVNPIAPHQIAIGCSDSTVRIFDRRMLGTIATGWVDNGDAKRPLCSFTVPEFDGNSYRITSLSYSPDGQDVLVSYSSDHLYLFSVKDQGSVHLRKDSKVGKTKGKKQALRSPQPVRRLRLRGDWSDTGPDARPEREGGRRSHSAIAQARPVLHTSLMQRMTDVLSRMLNDPATRAALNGGGEDSLESVIDEQVNSQANQDNSAVDNSEDRSNESVDHSEDSREVVSQVDRTGSTTAEDDHDEPEDTENSLAFNNSEEQGMGLEESRETPMETESSQNESQRTDDPSEETNNKNEETDESVEERKGNMMQNLQDKLTTMRDGFLERHRSEPAVSLTYSDISSTSATISLGVADELIRDTYHAGPSGSQGRTQDDVNPGPSNSRLQFSNGRENVDQDTYIDSDDDDDDDEEEDDAPPNQTASGSRCFQHGCSNPMETDVNNAIANALSSQKLQGQEIFDETYLTELGVKQKYMGHRNARTMIKEANFWGDDFVMSGSDCGHVFVWERDTAKLCMLLEADQHVVNCLQPHPYLPILATSGIDYDVKLWAPINSESSFDEKFADDLKKRNAVMLEETKDTITVPAVFMIRMLACLNQIRRGTDDGAEENQMALDVDKTVSLTLRAIAIHVSKSGST